MQRRSSGGQRPLLIVVDALDEAVSGSEITRISQLLTTIAAHPAARVVVATRRGHRDQLLHGLDARTVDAANLVDLDNDFYFDPEDLKRVATRHLTQDDVTHPGPPGHAWTQWTRRLLTALAFAYGPGLDDDIWLLFADALGLTATREDVLQLRRSPVADYLLETHRAERGQPVRTRLFHQALVDQLRAEAEPDDGPRILRHLTPTDDNGWATVPPYVRRYLINHAAADGDLLGLLRRPGYLSVADLQRVLATLPTQPTGELQEVVAILRLGTSGSGRFTQLQQTLLLLGAAGHLGLDTWCSKLNQLAKTLGGPTLLWAHPISSAPHQIIFAHNRYVEAVAIGRLGDRDVIVSGDDRMVRIWDQLGNPVGQPLTGHRGHVKAVAIGRLDDRDVIVSGSDDDRTIRIWDHLGKPIAGRRRPRQPLTGHRGAVTTVAIGRLDDRDVIVSGGNDRTIRIWDQHGDPVGQPLTGHDGNIKAVAIGRLDDRDVIISGSDRTIRIWDQEMQGVSVLPVVASVTDLALQRSVVYAAIGRALVAWRFE